MSALSIEDKTGQDKARRIIESAKLLFARFGIKKTSIEEIAQHAKLGKGTVYLYFKSKDDIFKVIAEEFASSYNKGIEDALTRPSTSSEKLQAFVETRVHFWDRCFQVYGLTAASILEAQANLVYDSMRREQGLNHLRLISELLDDARNKGEFQFEDLSITALTVYHALEALTAPWHHDISTVSVEDKIKTCSNLLFNGLVARHQNAH